MLIEWRKEFELGIPDVDHEHRELVESINRLSSVLREGYRDPVLDLLGEIHADISAHFALEERFMREHGYDEYAGHKEEHEQLLDELRDLMDDYDIGVWVDMESFGARIGEWFSLHFRTRDARLHRRLG